MRTGNFRRNSGNAGAPAPESRPAASAGLLDPLRQLAERFEELLLVDIDAASLADSVAQVGLEPELHARLSLLQVDVTGITDVFVERARAALALAGEDEVYAALLELLHGYRVAEPPRLGSDGARRAGGCGWNHVPVQAPGGSRAVEAGSERRHFVDRQQAGRHEGRARRRQEQGQERRSAEQGEAVRRQP